jgi:hypothetical protein
MGNNVHSQQHAIEYKIKFNNVTRLTIIHSHHRSCMGNNVHSQQHAIEYGIKFNYVTRETIILNRELLLPLLEN